MLRILNLKDFSHQKTRVIIDRIDFFIRFNIIKIFLDLFFFNTLYIDRLNKRWKR